MKIQVENADKIKIEAGDDSVMMPRGLVVLLHFTVDVLKINKSKVIKKVCLPHKS